MPVTNTGYPNAVAVADPINSSNNANVMTTGDGLVITGQNGLVVQAVEVLLNKNGTFDGPRSALGTKGIRAISIEGTRATFSYAISGYVPVTGATDILTLAAAASSPLTARLTRVAVSGISTSAASIDIQIVRRSAANSGGTSAPVTPATHDTNNTAAVSVLTQYSVNAASLGTAVAVLRSRKLNLALTGAAGAVEWDFGVSNDQSLVSRSSNQVLALNLNANTIPSGTSMNIEIEFTEDLSGY